jgi:hypothetical protein
MVSEISIGSGMNQVGDDVNSSKVSIFVVMPWLSDITCFLVHLMNASDDHQPINMIVYKGVPAWNMPITPPDPLECMPISPGGILTFPVQGHGLLRESWLG